MSHRPALAFLLCASLGASASAVEVIPSAKVALMGGQFFFQGQSTSFNGNADWSFAPGLKLSERDLLIPIVSGQYRRTREVQELIGGGFLTQETLDNTAGLRWVRLLSPAWNVKSTLSYKNELLTESASEKLGAGLFDYHKAAVSVELERAGDGPVRSVRQSLGAYAIRFYHYRALSAETADLGAEVNAGDRVLDFTAYEYSAAVDVVPAEGTLLAFSVMASLRPYRDQKVVTVAGTYLDRNRFDAYVAGAASARKSLPAWGALESSLGVNAAYSRLESDQHNYDAQNTRFNPGYYDYGEIVAGPFLAARWRKTLTVTAGYDYSRRAYDHRPMQDAAGTYGDKAIRLDTHTVNLGASCALGRGFSLIGQGTYRRSTSNMLYESSYRYNYWTANYYAGISWAL
ncbi:MAG: hypothetical protein NUW21_11305 [Elusimicrobia bacterium]|nr:hypothetical protein [Elusimicrobiota bacterium]